jgi:hypothetical protein
MKFLACLVLACMQASLPVTVTVDTITAPSPVVSSPAAETATVKTDAPVKFHYATDELWEYLKEGLNYLESPKPLQRPETIPPSYVHPDKRGFGAYGFSPEAYADVQNLYPYFQDFTWEQIMRSGELYDLANRAFCDWLIKNLQDYIPANAPKELVFETVHKAWNLGLGGFKKGRQVVASRTRRAAEFLSRGL